MAAEDVLTGAMDLIARRSANYRRDPSWIAQESYTQDDVESGFHRVDRPLARPGTSRFRVLFLALLMSVFPLIVVLTIAVPGILMGWGLDWIRTGVGREDPAITSGAVLLVAGSFILLLRLLYLVTADWRRRYVAATLAVRDYPVLYQFVAQVADAVNGPVPDVVKVDNEVGLVLRKRRGKLGVNKVELMIGLPLFYSLSARQLSGLIAHAYGGFSRSRFSLGYPYVANINRWLARLCDTGAMQIYEVSFARPWLVLFFPVDWLLNRYLRLLRSCAEFFSFSVSRGMDIQGDAYSARLGGATEFRATQIRLRALQLGKARVLAQLNDADSSENAGGLRFGHNDYNIARHIAEEADQIQFDLRAQLVREMEDLVSPLTRSRVVDLGRIVEVEKSQDEGACFLLGAAVRLLPDVDQLGQKIGARVIGVHDREI
ncbi:Hypothetical protein HDN1F_33000 [gamma proteobacterium HdN1]|nr:Hypothetical protein HDN1F_33000 [gamma proteobacterium HdN1]